jgi:serine/threonine protein kinase
MGGKCCGSKPEKRSKGPPGVLLTKLDPDPVVLYSDSRYFKPKQQSFYNNLLLDEPVLSEIRPPSSWETAEIIGVGSFGRVLFGRNSETGDLLAIKEIPLIGISNLTAVLEEVEILSPLQHPNIVRYLGSKTHGQCLLLFMEYVSGGTINSLIERYGGFSEALIRQFTYQVLKGLEYLHYHNIVHRDIKGTNILVTQDGACKLADFGSAKKILNLEMTSSVTGTIHWMAPEVINETGHGRHADIWSVGHVELVMKVCRTDTVPALPKGFSDDARNFVQLCLRRKPWDRPNVHELLSHPFVNSNEKPELFQSDSTKFLTDNLNS